MMRGRVCTPAVECFTETPYFQCFMMTVNFQVCHEMLHLEISQLDNRLNFN